MSSISGNRNFPNQPSMKPGQKPLPTAAQNKTSNVAKGILGKPNPGPAKMQAKPGAAKPGSTLSKIGAAAAKIIKK